MNIWIRQRGKILGPLPLENVITSYNAGKFAVNAEMSDDQVTWRPLSDLSRLGKKSVSGSPEENPLSATSSFGNADYPMQVQPGHQQPMAAQAMQPSTQGQLMVAQPMQPSMQGQPMVAQPMMAQSFRPPLGAYCRTCGAPVTPQTALCMRCGAEPKSGTAFCPSCGGQTNPAQAICMRCGTALKVEVAALERKNKINNSGKSAATAAILSFFLFGYAGQIYLGQTSKGILMLIVNLVTCGCLGILPIIGVIDAYQLGKKLEEGKSIGEWEWF